MVADRPYRKVDSQSIFTLEGSKVPSGRGSEQKVCVGQGLLGPDDSPRRQGSVSIVVIIGEHIKRAEQRFAFQDGLMSIRQRHAGGQFMTKRPAG